MILSMLGRHTPGIYVDVGSYLPMAFSNTYLLYTMGWQGIAIDPDPDAAAAFRRARPRDQMLELAAGTPEGWTELELFSDSSMNTVVPERAAETRANPHKRHLGHVRVMRRPLAAILAERLAADAAVDLMSIDCEGADLNVAQSNDWRRVRPEIVAIEDSRLDLARPEDSEIYRFMTGQGYHLENKARLTAIYRAAPKPWR